MVRNKRGREGGREGERERGREGGREGEREGGRERGREGVREGGNTPPGNFLHTRSSEVHFDAF